MWLQDQVVIQNSKIGELILIKLKSAAINDKLANLKFSNTIIANGIGKTMVTVSGINDRSEDAFSFTNGNEGCCLCQLDGSGHKCQSGGPGSIQCSCCGCSVTCEDGYYACCNPK